jgi:hypothetical protein
VVPWDHKACSVQHTSYVIHPTPQHSSTIHSCTILMHSYTILMHSCTHTPYTIRTIHHTHQYSSTPYSSYTFLTIHCTHHTLFSPYTFLTILHYYINSLQVMMAVSKVEHICNLYDWEEHRFVIDSVVAQWLAKVQSATIHHTACIIQHTSYIIQHTACIIHHTSYSMQHASCIMHHT